MKITTLIALLAIAGGASAQTVPAGTVDFAGLTKVSGKNIDFYYDAGLYKSAAVSGDELTLGLGLQAMGGFDAVQKVIAVAHTGVALKAQINSSLQGSFSLAPNTDLYAKNAFDAYFANYINGKLLWGQSQSHAIAGLQQQYIWDGVGMPYQGDLSSSIYPLNNGIANPLTTVSALLLNSSYLLSLGDPSSSTASVDTVTYGFEVLTPGTLPPVPEPASYAMLLAGLGLLSACAYTRRRR